MTKPILQVEHLNVWYDEQAENPLGKTKKRQVVRDVSFTVNAGEILGVLGESGSGKSTVARAVLGFIKDMDGKVVHFSEKPQMIFQDPYSSLNPVKKVGWLLKEPLRLAGGFSRKEQEARAYAMLERVGLKPEIAERYPGQLSGGQRQRVCIGIALMLEPKLLIADEAVSALDVTIQAQILELLLSLHRERELSILFISHDLRVVHKMCDRVLVMQDGVIVESGDADGIYFEPKEEYTKELLRAADL